MKKTFGVFAAVGLLLLGVSSAQAFVIDLGDTKNGTGVSATVEVQVWNVDDYDWDRVQRLGEASCSDQCQHLRYEMTNLRKDMCNEVFRCDLYEWDEETQECLHKGVEERKYYIPCRDIPPAM